MRKAIHYISIMEFNVSTYIDEVRSVLQAAADDEIAHQQAAYMRNKFAFFGIKTTDRRALYKPFLGKDQRPPHHLLAAVVHELWAQPERELHYFALELVEKFAPTFREADLALLEFLAKENQWWDSIDVIATKLLGAYFKKYPDARHPAVERWHAEDDFWLWRCAILFQLKYKSKTDVTLLASTILPFRQKKEFFIQKAIGWALREYRRTNAAWVNTFVAEHDLMPLSRREALKHGPLPE